MWRGKPLIIHEVEYEYPAELYWPEWRKAFIDILDVETFKGEKWVTKNIRLIERFGHMPRSVSARTSVVRPPLRA